MRSAARTGALVVAILPTAFDRLRPLCPYPKVAVYKGQGNTNDAANFVCRDPNATRGG